jgi:hypothetical protein
MSEKPNDIGTQGAIEIARRSISGKVELSSTATTKVERDGNNYVVTFVRSVPAGVRTADYDARVTIDARTGKVVDVLGGS